MNHLLFLQYDNSAGTFLQTMSLHLHFPKAVQLLEIQVVYFYTSLYLEKRSIESEMFFRKM